MVRKSMHKARYIFLKSGNFADQDKHFNKSTDPGIPRPRCPRLNCEQQWHKEEIMFSALFPSTSAGKKEKTLAYCGDADSLSSAGK